MALDKIRLLYAVEQEADDKQMSYEERRQLRMEVSVPILMGFEAWLQAEYPKVLPKSPIGKAIRKHPMKYVYYVCPAVATFASKAQSHDDKGRSRPGTNLLRRE